MLLFLTSQNHKVESAITKRSHRLLKFVFVRFRTLEFKLWILFLYYWIAILVQLISIAVSLQKTDAINKYLGDYILCSLGGYRDECRVYNEQLQDETLLPLVVNYIATVLLSFTHLINLFFEIPFANAKKRLKRLFSCVTC